MVGAAGEALGQQVRVEVPGLTQRTRETARGKERSG